jgi:signal transduction histidine kinase
METVIETHWGRNRLVALLLLLVITAAGAAAIVDVARTRARSDAWMDDQAELTESVVNEVVMDVLGDLEALAAFVEESRPDPASFDRFVVSIGATTSAVGVAYIALVPAAEIDEYIESQQELRGDFYQLSRIESDGSLAPLDRTGRTVFYPLELFSVGDMIRPYIDSDAPRDQIALGVDAGYDPAIRAGVARALIAGGPSLSDFIEVSLDMVTLSRMVIAAVPVHDEAGKTIGMVGAPLLEPLLLQNLDNRALEDVEWEVFPRYGRPLRVDAADARIYPIDVFGARWSLAVAPTAAARAKLAGLPPWVAAIASGTLVALAALVLWLYIDRRTGFKRAARLQQMADDKDRFLASVSHELRTPLTVVSGVASELKDRLESFPAEERADLMAMLVEQTDELNAIVEDLLIAARSDIGKVVVHYGRVDLAEEAARAIDSAGTEVIVHGVAEPAWADSQRVRQILRNLLSNANRYGGPTVKAELRAGPAWVEVVVADDGEGVSAEDREAMFESYRSVHDHDRSVRSIGLGLYISRNLAMAMGGSLDYEHDGAWSRFRLRLRRAEPVPGPSPVARRPTADTAA